MKASEVLKLLKVTRQSLSSYVKQGLIKTNILGNGRYDYDEKSVYNFLNKNIDRKNVLYARVSTNKQKNDLKHQIEILKQYAFSNGIKVNEIKSDIASGISFSKRKEFFELLDDIINYKIDNVIITYKDRLSRIAFEFFSILFSKFGTNIIVISEIGNEKLDSEEIFEEIVHLIHSFSMKLYSKRKNNKIEISNNQE
jgi:putative resolvase